MYLRYRIDDKEHPIDDFSSHDNLRGGLGGLLGRGEGSSRGDKGGENSELHVESVVDK
jgi:hypothetical protein